MSESEWIGNRIAELVAEHGAVTFEWNRRNACEPPDPHRNEPKQVVIRPKDFEIEIGCSESGETFVRVLHKPTGNERRVEKISPGAVGRTRDSLLAELRGLLFAPDDIRVYIGRSSRGDFIRVVHLPSGIGRTALLRETSEEKLLDAVLEELYWRQNAEE